ncbi:MFS transporter [Sinomonas sp. P47F7]|uniref:MFS transporter n=1 Tax=Sinomonas sp. P47F7 TaxID=3410987 RepID=UPI003BF4899B
MELTESTPTPLTESGVRRVVLAGGIGTLIEYYDYALYGYVSTIIAPLFFPGHDPVAALLSTLAVFALSYVIRPLGGIVFGWVGDRYGRRKALLITIIGIGLANTAVGLLPTYSLVGLLAPALLLVVRLAQGFFAGGEVGGAATVIAENAPAGKRARYGAWVPMGTNGGFAIASGAIGLIAGMLSDAQMSGWGWRIPFLIGLPLTIICYLVRRSLPNIDREVKHAGKHAFPLVSALRSYPIPLLKAIGIGIAVQGGAYIGSTFIAIYLVANLHYPSRAVYWITAGVTVFAVLLMPLTGRLADKIGVWPVALIGIIGYGVLTYPALALMNLGSIVLATAAYALIMINMSFLQVASFTLTPRLFPDDVRYTGTALATNLSVLIAGGTAPFVASLLVNVTGDLRSPYYFVVAACVVGLIALTALRRDKAVAHAHAPAEIR